MGAMSFMTDMMIKHGNMSSNLEDSSFERSNTDSLYGDPQTLKELSELETETPIKPPPEAVYKMPKCRAHSSEEATWPMINFVKSLAQPYEPEDAELPFQKPHH